MLKPKLIKISQWLALQFAAGSEPCSKTVINKIRTGQIRGEKIGGIYYVNED